jgi:hypothetical protein
VGERTGDSGWAGDSGQRAGGVAPSIACDGGARHRGKGAVGHRGKGAVGHRGRGAVGHRGIACESLEGFQEESKSTTRVAAVRLRPRLPARVEMRSSRASLSCVRTYQLLVGLQPACPLPGLQPACMGLHLRTYVPVTGRVAACVPTAGVAARVHGTTRFSVRGSSRASPASSSKWSTTCPTTHYLLTYYPVPTALPPSTDR